MRTREQIEEMLRRLDTLNDEGELEDEVVAIRETLVWVLFPETGDARITDYLPD